jgi:uncharacterized protein (DUF697 family)
MSTEKEAKDIIRKHVLWSMGAGLMPVPLFDIAAVTAIQMDMLKQLAGAFGADHTKSSGKAFVSGLTGGTVARIAASAVKAVPGIGTIVGAISMPVLSGASTYAVGQVAVSHFEGKGDLRDIDMGRAKNAYKDAFQKGKDFVSGLKKDKDPTLDAYEALEKLSELREKDVITDEEFETQKQTILGRL